MKIIFALLLTLQILLGTCQAQSTMKIIYVYDALCGWCYGFSPVMNQFYEKHKNELSFEAVSGGMITGDRIGPIGDVASYISWAYLDVEKATGVKFGVPFLEGTLKKGTAIFSSIKPSIALSVFKTIHPEQSITFASALNKAIYYDGLEPENINAYKKLALDFNLDADDFIAKMQDSIYLQLAEADFQKSNQLGVSGFPTVFVEHNNTMYKIASGYVFLQSLEENYLKIKQELMK
jgi:putative protein-disulfide isomerase